MNRHIVLHRKLCRFLLHIILLHLLAGRLDQTSLGSGAHAQVKVGKHLIVVELRRLFDAWA